MSLLKKREIDIIITYAMSLDANQVLVLDFEKSKRDDARITQEAKTPDQLGAWLIAANVAAFEVENGKGAAGEQEPYVWEFNNDVQDPLSLAKLFGHYFYNCCFSPSWYFSDQREFINGLINYALQDLPGYAEATWEV